MFLRASKLSRFSYMGLFSERYGYIRPSDVIIRETITPEIQNAICSCYDRLRQYFKEYGIYGNEYMEMEKYLWTYFLNRREGEFYDQHYDGRIYHVVATQFIEDKGEPWYRKLDLVESTVKYLYAPTVENLRNTRVADKFVKQLNYEFQRLNFAYRVVGQEIIEITSQGEINAIEEAQNNASHNIEAHLNAALELYARRPVADYRNSIKESISAVEAFCREKTGTNTLGKALDQLKKNGIIIPGQLKEAFEKLYAYTNQPDTGIRHALMDSDGTFAPGAEEALFMLVSCSSFLNYLNSKIK